MKLKIATVQLIQEVDVLNARIISISIEDYVILMLKDVLNKKI